MQHIESGDGSDRKNLTAKIGYKLTIHDGREVPTLVLPKFKENDRNEELKTKLLQGNIEYRERYAGLGTTVYEVIFSDNRSTGIFIRTGDYLEVSSLLDNLKPDFFESSEFDEN